MKRPNATVGATLSALVLSITFPSYASESLCSPPPLRTDAMDHPSKHAWDLFLMLNHPARNKDTVRGEPDCTKPIGSPGTTSVWETWRNASSGVYLENGTEPPEDWGSPDKNDEKPGVTPELIDAAGNSVQSVHDNAFNSNMKPAFSPADGVFDVALGGGFGETRMNKATYDFIRSECLYSRDGLQRYAKAVAEQKKPQIQFPVDSIEVKAAWLDLELQNIQKEKWDSYYIAEYKGRKYGLSALHVITKEIPNWFWATFHHKDVPENKFESKDGFPPPKNLEGTVWSNYRLGGTQVDFVTSAGIPTKLSDHYVEYNFTNSSCITCHATAAISPKGLLPNAQKKALCAMTLNVPDHGVTPTTCKNIIGLQSFKPGTDELVFERGVPDPSWFVEDGIQYIQTDFIWSILRGNKETVDPPQRCIWK